MKKKFSISLFLLIFNFFSFSQTKFFPCNTYFTWDFSESFNEKYLKKWYRGTNPLEKYPDGMPVPGFIETDDFIYKKTQNGFYPINKKDIFENEYGFLYFTYKGKEQYLIYGGNYYAIKYNDFFYEDTRINEVGEIFHKVYNSNSLRAFDYKLMSSDKMLVNDWESYATGYVDYSYLMQTPIKSVKMNVPFLSETIDGNKVVYDDDLLNYRWFSIWSEVSREDPIYSNCKNPMVEGDPGNGIGVDLDIEFYIPSDNLVILNGYVDWDKQHLYKNNARMKKIKVEGKGFSLKYEFEDFVHFAQIDFPKQVDKVKIIVLEVYNGSKWSDMAISGIWVNPDVTKSAGSKIAQEYLEYAKQKILEIEY